jgi:hypothetical protein
MSGPIATQASSRHRFQQGYTERCGGFVPCFSGREGAIGKIVVRALQVDRNDVVSSEKG